MKKIYFDLQLFAEPTHANPFVPGTTPGTPTTNPINRTSDGGWDPALRPFFNENLLENSHEEEIFSQFSKKGTIKGSEVVWSKFNRFRKATTPLKEGVVPASENFGMTSIRAKINQYGMYVAISDRLEHESLYDVVYGASEEMGYSMSETKNILARNILDQSTYLVYAADKDSGVHPEDESGMTVKNVLTAKMVHKMRTFFATNKVPKINGSWVWILHPNAAYDLTSDPAWVSVNEYAGGTNIFKGEIGELQNFRFIESSECTILEGAAGGKDVYVSYALGANSFGEVDAEGEGAEMILKGKEQAGGPLEQWSTCGFKFTHGGTVLYPERCVRFMSVSTFDDEEVVVEPED